MDRYVLSSNVKRLRKSKGLTQRALADVAGVSLPAIKNLERRKSTPRGKTVRLLAEGLEVPVAELFRPVRPLRSVRFRSRKRIRDRERIVAETARWLEDFEDLEDLLEERVPFRLEEVLACCSGDDPVGAALRCREALGLGTREPLLDVCGTLEAAGVKVRQTRVASEGFFGLSVAQEDGGPAIVINSWERIPVERQIFSAAHELGHLVLHRDAFDVERVEENRKEETEANEFASHFLMPEEGFVKEWEDAAGLHPLDRIFKVKRIFHVSYQTILFRLGRRPGARPPEVWTWFNRQYQKRYGHPLSIKEEPFPMASAEPFGLNPFDFQPDRFHRLVRKAIDTEEISLSRGAELLGISVEEMIEVIRSWETIH